MKLGIVGIGRIARDYIQLICQGAVPEAELTALCSRDSRRVSALREQFPQLAETAYFADYDAMLTSGQVEGVLICTPHGLHPAMTLQALRAGLPVLSEKPVGIFGDEVEQALAELARRPELVCGVLYNRRASAAFRAVKALMDGGELGELVRCTWIITNLYRTEAYYKGESWRGSWRGEGGGLLMTQASHQLDLMQWLCGMPSAVQTRCASVNRPIVTENEVELLLTYPNGARGQFIASAHECPGTNLLEICGTRGRVTVREDREVEILRLEEDERGFAKTCPSPFDKVPSVSQRLTFDDSDNQVQQAATIGNFIRAAQGREPIQCGLEEGYRSLQIIHGAYLSHWQGRELTLPVDEGVFRRCLEEREL